VEERLRREWKESGMTFQLAREGDAFDV